MRSHWDTLFVVVIFVYACARIVEQTTSQHGLYNNFVYVLGDIVVFTVLVALARVGLGFILAVTNWH
jgi:uncharacterized membrane protein YjjP (DUF1212 family)